MRLRAGLAFFAALAMTTLGAAAAAAQGTATRPADINHLGSEKSAYLRQHATNPVHWWAWGDAPFAEAARRDCPVFVSIGYASCHWCHVMERESFSDQAIADLMNAGFVCIKVDREERPDVDRVYMAAALAVGGGGGWPLNVVLTPERTTFLAFTYLPPEDRDGRGGLKSALTMAARNWQSSRVLTQLRATNLTEWLTVKSMPLKALDAHIAALEAEVARLGATVESAPAESRAGRQTALDAAATRLARAQAFRLGRTAGDPSADPLAAAAQQLGALADAVNGGLGKAPKFPTPIDALLLIRLGARPGAPLDTRPAPPHDPDMPAPPRLIGPAEARDIVRRWYDAMAAGAIHDSIGGGFHRYTTDAAWEHPHFEKMLYDQPLIALVWLELFKAGGAPHDAAMAAETLDFCRREMQAVGGGYIAALDADTGGIEGATYQWSRKQLTAALTDVDAGARDAFLAWCGADRSGNEDALFNLKERRTPAELTATFGKFEPLLAVARAQLATARAARPQPGRTEHVITGWNALLASAFARAAGPLNRPDFLVAARELMAFLERDLRRPDGLYARRRIAGESRFDGELADQAAVIEALVDLHAATGEADWLTHATALATRVIAVYGESDGGFTDSVAPDVPIRTRELADNAWPAGTSAMNMALARLALATNSPEWRARAESAFGAIREDLLRAPADMAWNVLAWDLLHGAPGAASAPVPAPTSRKPGE